MHPGKLIFPALFMSLSSAGLLALNTAAHDPEQPPASPAPAGQAGDFIKPTEAELRARLTPLQYDVTQEEATEEIKSETEAIEGVNKVEDVSAAFDELFNDDSSPF